MPLPPDPALDTKHSPAKPGSTVTVRRHRPQPPPGEREHYAQRLYSERANPLEWAKACELGRRWRTLGQATTQPAPLMPARPRITVNYKQPENCCFGATALFLMLRACGYSPRDAIAAMLGPAASMVITVSRDYMRAPTDRPMLTTKSRLYDSVRNLVQRTYGPRRIGETEYIPLGSRRKPLVFLHPIGMFHHADLSPDDIVLPEDLEVKRSWHSNHMRLRSRFPACPNVENVSSLQGVLTQVYYRGESPDIALPSRLCFGARTAVRQALPFIVIEYFWASGGRPQGHAIGLDLTSEFGIGVFDASRGWFGERAFGFAELEAFLVELWHSLSGMASRTPGIHGVGEMNLPADRRYSIHAYQIYVQMLT